MWNQVLYFNIDAERELHVTVKDECALVDLTLGAATASLVRLPMGVRMCRGCSGSCGRD